MFKKTALFWNDGIPKHSLSIQSSSRSMKTCRPINEIRSTMHLSIMHFNDKNLARYEDIQKQMWSQTNLNCETFEWPTNLIQMFLYLNPIEHIHSNHYLCMRTFHILNTKRSHKKNQEKLGFWLVNCPTWQSLLLFIGSLHWLSTQITRKSSTGMC